MPMHRAMREARLAIATTYNGGRTWGAYQHYGSPNFRFFDHEEWRREGTPGRTNAGAGTAAAKNGNLGVGASPIAGKAADGVDVVANGGIAAQDASTEGVNPEAHPEKIASAVPLAESDAAAVAAVPTPGMRADRERRRHAEAMAGARDESLLPGGADGMLALVSQGTRSDKRTIRSEVCRLPGIIRTVELNATWVRRVLCEVSIF